MVMVTLHREERFLWDCMVRQMLARLQVFEYIFVKCIDSCTCLVFAVKYNANGTLLNLVYCLFSRFIVVSVFKYVPLELAGKQPAAPSAGRDLGGRT